MTFLNNIAKMENTNIGTKIVIPLTLSHVIFPKYGL